MDEQEWLEEGLGWQPRHVVVAFNKALQRERDAALEEAAKVADRVGGSYFRSVIATDIRALKSVGKETSDEHKKNPN